MIQYRRIRKVTKSRVVLLRRFFMEEAYNEMARQMTARYEKFLKTHDMVERVAGTICSWVMSTIESIFWSKEHPGMEFDIYTKGGKVYLIHTYPEGNIVVYTYIFQANYAGENLDDFLKRFVEIFNNVHYPIAKNISSPTFRAYYSEEKVEAGRIYHELIKEKDEEDGGYYHVGISADMWTRQGEREVF